MKNGIFLIAGLVITVLYIFFSMQIYELMYYEAEFSQAMCDENMYLAVALITSGVAWAVAAIYYYAINSVGFARWYHWLIFLGIAVLLAAITDFVYPDSVFSEYDYEYTPQLIHFSLLNIIVEAVIFIVASYSMRWWSSNCRHTPIPQ
ncbi:MAG: hypothetical protein SOZ80_07920 [Prevotella sp.]|uniref:hypothetical protein n=1 Tax=Prevotella sp. TaxID=59823 RepID=UPI002A2E3890|nr:hypothetical protein [Prevotella sp.]MDD7317769.1 hypothetical protein [Prevotellaceae bacterium]MDY4020684.1 hypothetical protein [Prevotella sp.]